MLMRNKKSGISIRVDDFLATNFLLCSKILVSTPIKVCPKPHHCFEPCTAHCNVVYV